MNIPPPLPASPTSAASPERGARSFVTVLAWITLGLGALGVAYGLLQMLIAALMPADSYLRLVDPLGTGQVQLPSLLRWSLEHNLEIGIAEAILSALMAWLGLGLLRRWEWARMGFIVYLGLGTLLTFGGIWYVPALMDASLSMQAGLLAPGQPIPPELAGMKTLMTIFSVVVALVFTALHGGIIWKLCTPAVRNQFRRAA